MQDISEQEKIAIARARRARKVQPGSAAPEPKPTHPVAGAIRTAIGSLPGGTRLLALGRAIDEAIPYGEALAKSRGDVEEFSGENPRTSLALAVGANAPLFWNLPAFFATRAGGALLGGGTAAAQRAAAPVEESVGSRATGTLLYGLAGAGAGAAAPWLMGNPTARTAMGAIAGGLLAPEGVGPTTAGAVAGGTIAANPSRTADLVGRAAGRVLPRVASRARDFATAVGLPGQVNRELEGIDRTAKAFGGMVGEKAGTGQAVNLRAVAFKAKSNKLFARAKADPAVLSDKDVLALVRDPDVRQAFQAAATIESQAGRPVPRVAVGTREIPSNILQESGAPFTTTEVITEGVPNPATLHLTKRILRDIVEGKFERDQPIPIADALRIQPKVEALTKLLHSRSKDFAEADRFFQKGMVAEGGRLIGYGAAKPGMRNPAATAIGEKDVAGAERFVADQPDEELRRIASSAVRQGAKDQMREQVAALDLTKGRAGVLSLPGMSASGSAAGQRKLATGAQSPELERLLGLLDVETAGSVPTTFFAPWKVHAAKEMLDPSINPLERPGAREIIRGAVADPKKYQETIARYRRGMELLDFWDKMMPGQIGSAVGR